MMKREIVIKEMLETFENYDEEETIGDYLGLSVEGKGFMEALEWVLED